VAERLAELRRSISIACWCCASGEREIRERGSGDTYGRFLEGINGARSERGKGVMAGGFHFQRERGETLEKKVPTGGVGLAVRERGGERGWAGSAAARFLGPRGGPVGLVPSSFLFFVLFPFSYFLIF
jgi:hypothetical protein